MEYYAIATGFPKTILGTEWLGKNISKTAGYIKGKYNPKSGVLLFYDSADHARSAKAALEARFIRCGEFILHLSDDMTMIDKFQ